MLEQRDTDNLQLVKSDDTNVTQIHFRDGTVYDLTIHQTYPQMKVYRVFIPYLESDACYIHEGTAIVMARDEQEAYDQVDEHLELEPEEIVDNPNRYRVTELYNVYIPRVLHFDRGGNRDD